MLQETAILMAEPKCISIHYEVEDDRGATPLSRLGRCTDESIFSCLFFVQAWPGRTNAICEALDTAAQTLKMILEAD